MANAVDYGGGAGGKFRKRPFRRPLTPYDRPVSELRNSSSNINNGGSSGWISRIVDPASKIISYSAHKLFSSVFRKRLLPPPPPPPPPPRQPSPDNKVESTENHLEDVMTDDCSRIQERDKNEGNTQTNGPVTDGVAELERILNQKTFTRSEIDHLSVLLQSRTVDKSGIAGQRRFEMTPCEPPVGHSRQEELDGVVCGNKANPSEVPGTDLTPAVRLKVSDDDDIASPAELAKAYMGRRSTAVSSSIFGPCVQAVREENHALPRFQSHSPVVHTVQKPLSTPATSQNDFIIPRSRGRSALYSMARAPYSRVLPTETKGFGTINGTSTGKSLSTAQKVLKRRCSVLENDIGAVGLSHIRRIRQKSNLVYPKSLGQSSRTPLTLTTSSEESEASLYTSSKSQGDRGDKSKPVSSLHVPSKSIETGERILQQLEKMTPPKEKSSERRSGVSGGISSMELTPSILHGQARKSLETVDSVKYVHSGQVSGKIVDSLDTVLHKVQDATSEKQDKVYASMGKVSVNSSNKVHHENGDVRVTDNDVMGIAKNTAPVVLKSAVDVPKKSQAFHVSAYEEYLEIDDEAHLNGIVSPLINEGKRSLEASSVKSNGNLLPENPSLRDATKGNIPVLPELKPSSNLVLKKNTAMESSAPSVQPIIASVSTKADAPASTNSFGLRSSDKVSPASLCSSSVVESHSQLPSSKFAASGATNAGIKSPGSNDKSTEAVVGMFKKTDSTVMPTSGTDTAGKLTVFGNSTSSSLAGAASSATPSFTNAGFQSGSSTISSTNNQLQASSLNVSSQSMSGDHVWPSKTATSAATTESMPSQPAVSSGVNQSVSLGLSSMPASGSTNSASTNIFGGNTQPFSSQVFGSTPFGSSSSGFASGTSSVSAPANGSSEGVPFGPSSTSAAPSSPSAFATPQASKPAVGNGSSVFTFESKASSSPTSLGNNGQMKMEDSMVQDPMQPSVLTIPASGFSRAPAPSGANPFRISSLPNQAPAPSGANFVQFSSLPNQAPASSGANPFTFSNQQNQAPAPSGANPFQFNNQPNQAPASSGANVFTFTSQQNQAPAPSGGANPFQSSIQQNQAPSVANPSFPFISQQNQMGSGGGSFSLGPGGNDKTNRRIVKVRKMRKN